jgi:cytochrome c oxidase cbb3-type subunit 2
MRPAWRATWLYALAGWIGSAAGVGLAEQFGRVPLWAAPTAAVVLAVALFQLQFAQ